MFGFHWVSGLAVEFWSFHNDILVFNTFWWQVLRVEGFFINIKQCITLSNDSWQNFDLPGTADNNVIKVPEGLSDEKVIFLSDILPTGWHANELARLGEGDNVAIWGAGPSKSKFYWPSCAKLFLKFVSCLQTPSSESEYGLCNESSEEYQLKRCLKKSWVFRLLILSTFSIHYNSWNIEF